MKHFIFILALTIFAIVIPDKLPAQKQNKIEFTYDDAGNRLTKNVIYFLLSDTSKNNNLDTTNVIDTSYYNNEITKYTEKIGLYTASIYPNPTMGKLILKLSNIDENINAVLFLTNTSGKAILRKKIINKFTEVDISKHERGTYILTLIIGDKKISWKIIKQ